MSNLKGEETPPLPPCYNPVLSQLPEAAHARQ